MQHQQSWSQVCLANHHTRQRPFNNIIIIIINVHSKHSAPHIHSSSAVAMQMFASMQAAHNHTIRCYRLASDNWSSGQLAFLLNDYEPCGSVVAEAVIQSASSDQSVVCSCHCVTRKMG
jgi:hypothetical protein